MHLTAFPSYVSQLGAACFLACAASAAVAQIRPDAGQTQREAQPTAPLRPAPSTAPVTVQSPQAVAGQAASTLMTPTALTFSGNSVFSAAELSALVQDGLGKPQTLGQLNQLLLRINAYYQTKGYPFARAFLPPQDIKDGKVSVTIVEGKYGSTQLTNKSAVRDSAIQAVLAPLASGQPIQEASLQRQMLLLQDLPGIQPNAALVPGTAVGTADLRVLVNPGTKVFGSGEFDTFGGAYTGRTRLGASLGVNNVAGLGDQFTLRALTSGKGLSFVRAAYQVPLGGDGWVVGANVSTLQYDLDGPFAVLDANGKANNAGLVVGYPIIRSPNNNLRLGLAYDRKTSQDRINALLDITDKTNSILTASLTGDLRQGSGITSYSLAYTSGKLSIDPLHLAADVLLARTAGSYSKLNLSLQHQQAISASSELALSYSTQMPSKNLSSVEKMTVGGPGGVRAYSTSEASGDRGHLLSAELRYVLQPGWQLSGFVDAAQTTINQNLWAGALAPGVSNKRSLAGTGLGLQWSHAGGARIKAQLATRLGSEAATADKNSRTRLWLQGSIAF